MIEGGVAIDIGAAWHGGPDSWELLMEFKPHTIYGFDPALEPRMFIHEGTRVELSDKAAWTYYGWVLFSGHGFGGHVTAEQHAGDRSVRCFDLAAFILSLGDEPIVLKMDCEGAEYPLLRHLIDKDATRSIWKIWVEWHKPRRGMKKIMEAIDCEWAEWTL